MKYKYTITINEQQARDLNIRIKEPVSIYKPESTDWEVLETNNELVVLPNLFIETSKINWIMKPNFEWSISILLNKPISTKDDSFMIMEYLPLNNLNLKRVKCLIHVKGGKSEKSLVWNQKKGDFRLNE